MAKKKETDLNLFDIDLTRLEDECVEFPTTYFIHAKMLADARELVQEAEALVEIAKAERKEVEASLRLKIQSNPKKYKMADKPTVAAIDAKMVTQKAYQRKVTSCQLAQDGLNNAWSQVNNAQAILNSLDKKSKQIENLVKLHGQSYFAKPVVDDEDTKKYIDNKKKKKVRRRGNKK